MPQDWFSENAPAQTSGGDDWFSQNAPSSVSAKAKEHLAGDMGLSQIPESPTGSLGERFGNMAKSVGNAFANALPSPEPYGGMGFATQMGPVGAANAAAGAAFAPVSVPAGYATEKVAGALGASPETAQAVGDVGEQVAPLAVAPLLKRIPLVPNTEKMGDKMVRKQLGVYGSDVKGGMTIGGKKLTSPQIDTAVGLAKREGVMPSQGGAAIKRLQQIVRDAQAKKTSMVSEATEAGVKIPIKEALSRSEELQKNLDWQVNPETETSAVQSSRKEFEKKFLPPEPPPPEPRPKLFGPDDKPIEYPPEPEPEPPTPRDMTPIEAERIKETTYARLGDRAYKASRNPADILNQKVMNSAVKDSIAEGIPGMGDLNADQQAARWLDPIIRDRSYKLLNRTYFAPTTGVTTPAIGDAANLIKNVLDKTGASGRLAIRLSRNTGISFSAAQARIAAYAASLNNAQSQYKRTGTFNGKRVGQKADGSIEVIPEDSGNAQ